mgnify:CR=1 FL=1
MDRLCLQRLLQFSETLKVARQAESIFSWHVGDMRSVGAAAAVGGVIVVAFVCRLTPCVPMTIAIFLIAQYLSFMLFLLFFFLHDLNIDV